MSAPEPIVWLDGELLPASQARVSVYDRAFRNGEGVFETMRIDDGHPFRLEAYVQRALTSAAALGLDVAGQRLRRAVTEVVAANAERLPSAGLRLTISAGELDPTSAVPGRPAEGEAGRPTVVATMHPLPLDPDAPPRPVTAATVQLQRALPHVKAVSYLPVLVARRTARERGADEALLLDDDGQVLEAGSANVAVLRGRSLATPPVDAGIMAGIARQVLLEVAPSAGFDVTERPITLAELLAAEEVVLTASTRQVFPLVAVDGHLIGNGAPGPSAAALLAAYRAEVAREREATARDEAVDSD
ncbi:MAG: aminotransferase class IV [Nitriliruptoraceae bacterium]